MVGNCLAGRGEYGLGFCIVSFKNQYRCHAPFGMFTRRYKKSAWLQYGCQFRFELFGMNFDTAGVYYIVQSAEPFE